MGTGKRVVAHADEQLIAEAKGGEVDAFAELYDRYCHRAYRLARSICHDDGRAEEAVQEAFLSLWRQSAQYRPRRGTVAAWLMAVVRHRAIDVARRDARHGERRVGGEAATAPQTVARQVADQVVAREEALRLQSLLSRIPDTQREVITLAFYGGLSHSEIAHALGLPSGTVKGRMRLGLNKLRSDVGTGGEL